MSSTRKRSPAARGQPDALTLIRARGHVGIRLGLARMRALLARLDDPQRSLRGALVGGTNGKGSTQAMVAEMLRAGGLRVGQAPSPHLSSYQERIVVDGRPISRGNLETVLRAVLDASLPGERRHGPATQFELLIAAAFLWFSRRDVDVAVVEVGLGGRLDATNTWDGGVAVITNVGLDHQQYLGPTIASIAREKAAIIKAGDRAVTGAHGTALGVIRRRAERLGVDLRICSPLTVERLDVGGTWIQDETLGSIRLRLLGRHQAANAAVALGTMAALAEAGIAAVDDGALRRGLSRARWPGRLEVRRLAGLTIVLDGAHNPDGARELAVALEELRGSLPGGRATLLLGILRDKEVAEMLAALAHSPLVREARLIACRVPDTDRSLSAEALARQWRIVVGEPASAAAVDDADEALGIALELAREEGGPLLIAGSLYLVGHARARLLAGGHLDD